MKPKAFIKIVYVLSMLIGAQKSSASLLTTQCMDFTAPRVANPGEVIEPEVGSIIFDESTSRFAGFTGSSWHLFSSITLRAPTVQKFVSGSGTYTTPANVLYLKVRMVGGGGGGGGPWSVAGSPGGDTSFNSVVAKGGGGGPPVGGATYSAPGGTGGTGSATLRIAGGGGSSATNTSGLVGGVGGSSAFGGAGPSGGYLSPGIAAAAGSGSGGSGGNLHGSSGGSGGAGEYVELLIGNPAATYPYSIGAGGAGGAYPGYEGGNGGSGFIEIMEYYQ